tara:strand:- start:73 stop:1314 length:1242 start_codon:yes stop_codon:yes gene_type:complete
MKLILFVKTFNSIKSEIIKSPKKNVVFLEGGFGVISTHCYSLPFIFNKKNTQVFWLVKSNFNPQEMIDLWQKRVDVSSINIFKVNFNFFNFNSKKILIFLWKKIAKISNKNFYDIYDFDILFIKKYGIKKFELLERKNKNFHQEGYNFHNEKNIKKYHIFRSPFLSQIVKNEKSSEPLLKYNKGIEKKYFYLKSLKKVFFMLYVRKRNVPSLEGVARNGSGLINYLSTIKFLNKKGYVPLINGDFSKKDISILKKRKALFFDSSKLKLSDILFYQLSNRISKFVISEYGGGTCLPFTLKKRMLLLNFFPISNGYPNSLIFPKIYIKKKKSFKNIEELFQKKAFNEFIKNNEFRELDSKEICEASKEFYYEFLYKTKIYRNKVTRINSNFSSYLKTSKYSETYIKIQSKELSKK